ncbi:HEPN domain-containing protein [Pseudoalteromonas sp. L1]|uniref:HEPN domain-containing protein n=1 Tax=Pseudoalteromonas sp. L1 TaxID=195716 RepID=UPI001F19C6D8|nr:hypothetical protein [Pseudoalteromonas sp. L1]
MVKQLINNFNKALPFFELVQGTDDMSIKQVRLYGKEYSITKWDDKKYKESVNSLYRLFPQNSRQLLEGYYSSALADILIAKKAKETINIKCEELIESVKRNTKERTVCIPIQGLDLRADSIDFGFGKLYKSNQGTLASIISDHDSLHSYQHGINALEKCSSYFQIKEVTDHKRSLEIAKLATSYACNLLSFIVGTTQFRTNHYVDNWHSRNKETEVLRKRKISTYGAESGDSQVYYEFYKNDDPFRESEYLLEYSFLTSGHDASESINEAMEVLRPKKAKTTYHLIDNNVIDLISSPDYSSLLSCINQNGEIDKRLFQSVNWFGKAINSDIYEEQFLFFAISIESLLVGDEPTGGFASQGSINQKISERAAFLAGDDLDSCLSIEKEIKELYGIRSKIVHTGAKAKNSEVLSIEKLAKKIILSFSKKNFKSHQDFLKWIKINQYGSARGDNTPLEK